MKKRSGFQVMTGLIGMIRPLLGYMFLAVLMGCIGNLMATFLTVLGGYGILQVLAGTGRLGLIFGLLAGCAALRGILRYAEQMCNHYIAFKLLARIRHKVFRALRRLAPAKLDGSEKGNLISIITSDIELLEVFYAHTISPIAIAVITSIVMIAFIGWQHPLLGAFAAVCYILVGALIPLLNGRIGRTAGQRYRTEFGCLGTTVLDNLYGLDEILQYRCQKQRLAKTTERTAAMEASGWFLKKAESIQMIVSDGVILAAGVLAVVLAGVLIRSGRIGWEQGLIAVVALMSSFGPTAALSALSNNLNQTLASGDRVLGLLDEEPLVEEIKDGGRCEPGDISCRELSFRYPGSQRLVLERFSETFAVGQIHGILGCSGCGKSTLLKLLMRFYRSDRGRIAYGGSELETINTDELRRAIAYVAQETFLFQDTIANNIRIARPEASLEEVAEAARKAAIHDFIERLPQQYETRLTELGSNLSGGERQRLGLARAFLQDGRIILLDEPTSNIDSLNEGLILKSLAEEKADKTIILVSHRKSTMGIADHVVPMCMNDMDFYMQKLPMDVIINGSRTKEVKQHGTILLQQNE